MRIQILYLDPHDDQVSARDKLGWAKAPRVLLVWPSYGQILNRKLDLVLLQRYAEQRSFQLGLVTRDPAVIEIAHSVGIPTFPSVDEVKEQGWRRPARTKPFRSQMEVRKSTKQPAQYQPLPAAVQGKVRGRILHLIFFSLALLSVFLLPITLIPRAEVRLSPVTQEISLQAAFHLDPTIEKIQPDGRIPGYPISSTTAGSFRLPTSGSTSIPATPAEGMVIFTNLTSDRIIVPVGTGLRSTSKDDLRFITTTEVEIPDEEGAQIQCPVVADFAGPQGNVPAAAIDAIEGTLGLQLEVSNPEAFERGDNLLRAAVASTDRDRLERELTRTILEEAEREMVSRLEPGEILITESLYIIEIHQRTFDREVGEPADSISLELELEVGAILYRETDLETAVRLTLAEARPEELHVVRGIYDYEVSDINAPSFDQITLAIKAWQYGYKPIDEANLRNLLRAQPPYEAVRILQEELDLETTPDIRLRPTWLPRLPLLPLMISFRYDWAGLE